MNNPAAELRGIWCQLQLKQFQLALVQRVVAFITALILYIILQHGFISMLTYRTHKVTLAPKLTTPQLLFH